MSTFLLSCGGTGGHLAPGIALAEGLAARGHEPVLLISRKKIDARLIEKYPRLKFVRMPGAPLAWSPAAFARFVVSQSRGFLESMRLVRRLRPAGIVGFGGFTTTSIILAGVLHRVPVALHEANRVPGRAIRLLGGMASRIYLPPGVRMPDVSVSVIRSAGLPVRAEIRRLPREEARERLGLDPRRKVLAIFGGSQGATALNDWARNHARRLAARGVQLYCVTGPGKGDGEEQVFKTAGGAEVKAVFVPFSDRVAELLSAADLVVARAGAGSIAEFVRCQTPAILVPYPHAADNHQAANAAFFERQGGGLVLDQDYLVDLWREVEDLVFNDGLLRKFRDNLARMDREQALSLILDDIEHLAARRPDRGDGRPEPTAAPAS